MAIENVWDDVTFNLRHNNKRDQLYKYLGGGVGKGTKYSMKMEHYVLWKGKILWNLGLKTRMSKWEG